MKMFNRILSIFIILSSFSANAETVHFLNVMPLEARQALLIWNNQFKIFALSDFTADVRNLFSDLDRTAPMRVVADYNGDQIDDFALLGEAGQQQYLVVVLSGPTWQVKEVERWSEPDFKTSSVPGLKQLSVGVPVYLTRAGGSLAEEYAAQTRSEALQYEAFLGAVRQFKINQNRVSRLEPKNKK